MRFSLLLLTLCVLGCQSDDNTPVDPFHLPPFVKNFAISPSSINTDTINVGPQRLPTDSLRIAVTASVQASDPEGLPNVKEITARVYKPASQDLIRTAQLQDNGSPPDASAGDGTFSGVVQFVIVRSDIGDFKVEVTATNKADLSSNSLATFVSVVRLNKPPILSDLVAPDSAFVGTSTVSLRLSIRAMDPDGQGDIQRVFFNSFRPDGTLSSGSPFQMYDDGSENFIPPSNVRSGDAVKGDGIFTLTVNLPSGTATGRYRFEFQAADRSGSVSNTIVHSINVR